MNTILMVILSLASFSVMAQSKVAMVKLIRGDADVLTLGKTTRLQVNDWVENGSVVKTAEKSFVKLVFIDKSQMNVGPNSEMKIESFTGKDSGVIDLVKGKIRSQVTKDYLQIKEKDKSKLFIKTQNAVMGVRGTDFMISTNGTNTSTVLFEGEVVFNKLENRGELSSRSLEEIVDRGVRMYPGEFSVMEANRPMPTVPALLNVQQREKLEKNVEMNSDRTPSNATTEVSKSIVPAGLSGTQVSNNSEILKTEVTETLKDVQAAVPLPPSSTDPEGFVKGDLVKPANGSFVHIESGVIIPPDANAVLDGNTNTFIPGPEVGKVASDGSYIPPKNVEITENGDILVALPKPGGKPEVVPHPKGPPTLPKAPWYPTPDSPSGLPPEPTKPISDIPLPGTGTVDTRFSPTGGIINVNDPTRQSTLIDATIIVTPR